MSQCDLSQKNCLPCEGGVSALTADEAKTLCLKTPYWLLDKESKQISRTLTFKNYYEAVACFNAIAFMAHQENHHPDIVITYNSLAISYTTHAIDGLSENDFICAAKVDALLMG